MPNTPKIIHYKSLIKLSFNKIYNNIISSNYLFVSGKHRVHCNTNVCSRFCCTTHPFQAFGYHRCCPTWGSVFILVFRRGVCANAAVYFKAISPMTQPHRFLVSLHIHDTRQSLFGFLPVPCVHCFGFRDCGTTQRSTLCL